MVEEEDAAHVARALYPGFEQLAHTIGATMSEGADGILRLHVTRHAPQHELNKGSLGYEQEHLVVGVAPTVTVTPRGGEHPVAPHSFPEVSMMHCADVAVHHGLASKETVLRVLEGLMNHWPGLRVAGVITSAHSCMVGWWRHVGEPRDPQRRGAFVTMAREDATGGLAPIGLYPSLLYGWMIWWCMHHGQRSDGRLLIGNLPAPPARLELVDDSDPHRQVHIQRVALRDYHETVWPERP